MSSSQSFHTVIVRRVEEISDAIRIFRLEIPENGSIKFLPGQWLDTFVPDVPQAGGFTITSPPSAAQPTTDTPGHLELAIQRSPSNPAAIFFWKQPASTLLGTPLRVRVGGSFVYPPPGVAAHSLRKLVLVAGGLGVNPLVSMLGHLAEQYPPPRFEVRFLYSAKYPGTGEGAEVLFQERVASIFARERVRGELRLFLTGGGDGMDGEPKVWSCNEVDVPLERRRMTVQDVVAAVGKDKHFAAVYVCGVPAMTDEFVSKLTSPEDLGMEVHRVLFEKWW